MLDRKTFIETLDFIEGRDSTLIEYYKINFILEYEDKLVDLLKASMKDKHDNISYFIYDLNMGETREEDPTNDPELNEAFRSKSNLYDYLVKHYNDEV